MTITSAIVLYLSIWAIVFFMVLPQGMVSQADDGDVLPGTSPSAPANTVMRRKMLITTLIAAGVFAVVASVIHFRLLTLDDIPFLTPPNVQ